MSIFIELTTYTKSMFIEMVIVSIIDPFKYIVKKLRDNNKSVFRKNKKF